MFKKTKCYNCNKKYCITAVAKTCFISGKALTAWTKHLKFGKEKKLYASSQYH
ncbi:hypothetical protein [Wolbachia endosymbiont of Litomosoides sigmodontis]|uniref:hypothetical protein n=1 Tax=Wolbachia endosymbiont of Litomosoides sigmodontis TaxID=80850 RepID=UPI001C5501AD|nr:hypothetical protein [Wolbachia endosymbiont of Litomosoides sigmodontis]